MFKCPTSPRLILHMGGSVGGGGGGGGGGLVGAAVHPTTVKFCSFTLMLKWAWLSKFLFSTPFSQLLDPPLPGEGWKFLSYQRGGDVEVIESYGAKNFVAMPVKNIPSPSKSWGHSPWPCPLFLCLY